ncbi:MAG TPA: NADH-quinone oxidoreductase subunit C, partial [Myxococcota bacterium]|nr:NADH-quinone oxidoreductase subunit C [Myxococcota bacterium]
MSGGAWARSANGVPLALAALPSLPLRELAEELGLAARRGERVAALFGVPRDGGVALLAVLASDHEGAVRMACSDPLTGAYRALTPSLPSAHLFEREIWEQTGLRPEGHPWLKPVRFPPRAGVPAQIGVSDFYRVEGEEVHEVAVGPVHAGVIEP